MVQGLCVLAKAGVDADVWPGTAEAILDRSRK